MPAYFIRIAAAGGLIIFRVFPIFIVSSEFVSFSGLIYGFSHNDTVLNRVFNFFKLDGS